MTKDSSNPRSPVKPNSQTSERQFDEFADLIFLALNHCTNEPQLTNFSRIADENRVAVGQIVAAAMAQIILHHYEIHPKDRPIPFQA